MDRRPSSAGPLPGRVTLTLHGPISELAAALRTLADALDREQASGAVTYAAAAEADDSSPAPGGMTAALADRFVAQLSPAAVDVLALLCHNAPQLTYEDLQAQAQAQLGIGRAQIGGVLTSLAAGRKRLPREVDYPIKRDAQSHRVDHGARIRAARQPTTIRRVVLVRFVVRMRRVLSAWTERFGDPHLPRTLSRRLRDAGFQIGRREVLVLLNSEYDPNSYSVANGEIMGDFAVARGGLTRDEADAWTQDLQWLGEQGRYFFSLNRYLFLATR